METVAIYWEPKIKTFGFEMKTDRCLFDWTIGESSFCNVQRVINVGESLGMNFDLVYGQKISTTCFKLSLIISEHQKDAFRQAFFVKEDQKLSQNADIYSHVDLIYFLGPHFGDRYGIADYTLKAIGKGGFTPIATVFSGSSVYLVLPCNTAVRVKRFFSERFDVPVPKSRLKRLKTDS